MNLPNAQKPTQMKIKTSELERRALDWAVSKALGRLGQKPPRCCACKHYEERQGRDDAIQYCHHPKMDFVDGSEAFGSWPSDHARHEQCPINELTAEPYSTDWAQGGPIIYQARIQLQIDASGNDFAVIWKKNIGYGPRIDGPTPLIAGMRCYVASEMGDEIEVPDELV